MTEPISVLFVCTGNSARSQMAEAWLRKFGGERFAAFSAGTHPSKEVHPLAVATMAEVGIDISGQHTKSVFDILDQGFDYVITVCDQAHQECPVIPNAVESIHWGFDDPAAVEGSDEQKRRAFRRVREEIRARVALFSQLKQKAKKPASA